MTDHLAEIIRIKRTRVEKTKEEAPDDVVHEQALLRRRSAPAHALANALNTAGGISIIAEFKRRSPSKGEIRPNADPVSIAMAYQSGGAKAISVLTEEDHFQGSLNDLIAVRDAVSLPVLRKDFLFDPYQIYESAAVGADAILLIVAALDDDNLRMLREVAEDELQIDALVEVHNADEMRRATRAGAKLIGVNNRDLRTFKVSIETSVGLAGAASRDVTLVSESGLNSWSDLKRLSLLGYKGFLVGESLMRSGEPGSALRALIPLSQ